MAKLNFSLDGKLLSEFALDKERITIGRRPTNDIHIDNLAVSGEHAMILTMGNDSFLEDLNSTNGTMVNHKLIKKHVLQHNDVIEFGKYQLKYLSDNQAKKPQTDGFVQTMLVSKPKSADAQNAVAPVAAAAETATMPVPIQASEQAAEPLPEQTQEEQPLSIPADGLRGAANTARLQVLNGANVGQELMLNRAMVKLGMPGVQLAVITKRPHGYFVSHVEGDKRPLVNGQSIGMQAQALNDLDVIELADLKVEFHLA